MPTLTVKNLEPEVHKVLKREADREGRSLNSFLVSVLERVADESRRRARMREVSDDLEAFVRELPQSSDAVDLLRDLRQSR